MSDEIGRLQRRIERERTARKEAERLLEEKSLELYNTNLLLQGAVDQFEQQVVARTTELSQALQAAEDANRQLRDTQSALEQQLFAIDQHTIASIADPTGKIVYANDRFINISGYRREELLGQNHRLINSGLHPKEMFADMWRTITAGKVWSGEIRNRRKDGSFYWVSATIVPFLDAQGVPYQYLSIRTDITPTKQAEAVLQQTVADLRIARDAAEAANKAKSAFLANMSHEIRTPMNGIIGMTDLALDAISDDERQGYMQIVKTSAESLLEILNDILDFSKIEAGKLSIEHIAFNLRQTVAEGLRPLELRAIEKGIGLRYDIADDVPAHVSGDPTRLRQVLINLVSNAIKFTDMGGVTVTVSVTGRDDHRASLRFSVRDSGIGIPQDKLATIFEAFSQADTSTTRKYGGTGLGLTITQRLVGLMGGTMAAESTPGLGSTFHCVLPYDIATGPVESPPAAAASATPSLAPLAILLVEDNPINQELAIRLLEKWGHRVSLAEHGQAALDRIAADATFDIVLMDMQMPVMGGIEATRRIRALEIERGRARLPIVAMTANAMQSDREACLDAGMDDYLSKPIRSPELAAKLRLFAPAGRLDENVVARTGETSAAPPAPGFFDYRAAIQAMDAEIIEILTPTFLEHYAAELAALRAAVTASDSEETLRRAHSLKGTLAAFGAQPGERHAAEIEVLARAGDTDKLMPLYTELAECVDTLAAVLQAG